MICYVTGYGSGFHCAGLSTLPGGERINLATPEHKLPQPGGWGSFFAEPELPPQLLRVPIDETDSDPHAAVETFAQGFAHPIDIVVDRDGTLLLLDYGEGGVNDKGTLYRIVYTD